MMNLGDQKKVLLNGIWVGSVRRTLGGFYRALVFSMSGCPAVCGHSYGPFFSEDLTREYVLSCFLPAPGRKN